MAALEKLGTSLTEAIRRVIRAPIVDEAAVKELVKDFQRTLLQADVNVHLVFDVSETIQKKVLEEKLPPGVSRREHLVKVIYDELTALLGKTATKLQVLPGKSNVFMLVGIQGSGKTTSAAKLANYFQKRGFKTALVCADTFRLGAYEQLKQLADRINVQIYRNPEQIDALNMAQNGVDFFRKGGYEVILLDTAGRHKNEKSLIHEMGEIVQAVHPDEIILVIDGTIGQQASSQAEAFHKATAIGSIFLTKLDGSARGGGALSAVATIGVPIKYIGTGEEINALEPFVPSRFVGRLLGMGDIEGLLHKVKAAETTISEKTTKDLMKGRFTLEDMYAQMEAMSGMGPLKHLLQMIPGMGYNLPEDAVETAEVKMKKWRYIIQSMTKEEKENPKIMNASRIRRVAIGSGISEKEVKELLKQYESMRRLLKSMGRKRLSPALGRIFGQTRFKL
jgi:signal recognition particle subunit SRP54